MEIRIRAMFHGEFFWREAEMPAREESRQSHDFEAVLADGVQVLADHEASRRRWHRRKYSR